MVDGVRKFLTQDKYRRWLVLFLVSVGMGANYYVYDAMSSIKQIMQMELGFTNTQYGWYVSAYSICNTFLLMTIFGGIILDKFGVRRIGFLFTLFCTLGAFLTAYGVSDYFRAGGIGYGFFGIFLEKFSPEFKMMLLGRILYGLGAETSIVTINKICVKWFKGKELSFAFGINLSIARMGTAAALILSPILIETKTGWTLAIWFASVLMGIGLIFFILYMIMDLKKDQEKVDKNLEEKKEELEETFHLSGIVSLLTNKSFILITLLCVTFYSAVFPFQAYCPDILYNKFGLSLKLSGILTSLIIWGAIVFTPLFGLFVDKKGKRASLMVYGSAMLLIVHLSLVLTPFPPYLAMIVLGIAFSLVPAAMWPAIARIVDEKRLGTAYGLMTAIQNIGLFAFPILAGWITDLANPKITPEMVASGAGTLSYTYTMIMFSLLGILGLTFSYLLKREDYINGNKILELPEAE